MPKSSYSKKGSRKGGNKKRLRTSINSYTTGNRTLRNITPNSGWLAWKCVDITSSLSNINSNTFSAGATAQIQVLNDINEGAGFYNRIGRTVCLRSLTLDYRLYPVTGLTQPPQGIHYIRVAVVYDAQPNGSVATFANVFQNISVSGAVVNYGSSFPNVDNKDRFKILYDRVHQMNPNAAAAGVSVGSMVDLTESHIKKRIALKNLETKFSAATSANASGINTGALLFMCLDYNSVNEISYNYILSSRCMFTD